jgi:hypothetical protein
MHSLTGRGSAVGSAFFFFGVSLSRCGGSVAQGTQSNLHDAGSRGSDSGPADATALRDQQTPTRDAFATDQLSPAPEAAPALDGGSLPLACLPDPATGAPAGQAPGCTFVSESACENRGSCGCGCACTCGICDCTQYAGAPGCSGMTTGSASTWVGTWTGLEGTTSSTIDATCAMGLEFQDAGGAMGQRAATYVVTSDGNSLAFTGGGCSLPFVVTSGTAASLVPGSACVASGLPACNGGSVTGTGTSLQTYYSGSATFSGGMLTLSLQSVSASLAAPGTMGMCGPSGTSQVGLTVTTARLFKHDGG